MNIQSWILLFIILFIVSYIVYNRYIKDGGEGHCKNCAQAKKSKLK